MTPSPNDQDENTSLTIWCGPNIVVAGWQVTTDTVAEVMKLVGNGVGLISAPNPNIDATTFVPARSITRVDVLDQPR